MQDRDAQAAFSVFGRKIWQECRKISQSCVLIMTVLEWLHNALPITKAVKTLSNPQSRLHVADVSLCWEGSICVCEWGGKKSIKGGFIWSL